MFPARQRWTVSASGWSEPDRAGQPGPQPSTFIDRALASPAPNPSFLSKGRGQPSPQSFTFIDRPARPPNPSLLSTGQPGPPTPHFYWPTPHFYWPDPSLLSAKSGRAMPDRVGPCRAVSAPCRTVPCQARPCLRVGLTLAHPCFKRARAALHLLGSSRRG